MCIIMGTDKQSVSSTVGVLEKMVKSFQHFKTVMVLPYNKTVNILIDLQVVL